VAVRAQDTPAMSSLDSLAIKSEIKARLTLFMDDLNQLYMVEQMKISLNDNVAISPTLVVTFQDRMNYLNQSYNSLDVKWNTYYQASQLDIAADEELMEEVAKLEQLKQSVKDTLDLRTQQVDAIAKFASADKFIISHVDVYKKLYTKAYKLSLLKKFGPMLEKVKAKEQVVFGELQTNFEQAKAASELVPTLNRRMETLDEQYVIMKSVSEKVQALEYKPWMQRIKDYVMGLAAVAIILMFVNGIWSKFKAYKDKAANLKKYNDMLKNNGKDTTYPTI
jgi:isoleucyl-tRNA synthetase